MQIVDRPVPKRLLQALVRAGGVPVDRYRDVTHDLEWTGWWGDEPPYHGPVFVLTHHPREPFDMQGGTTFTFVTEGVESALEQARMAAGDRDVAIAGGAQTINQFLAAGLIDELRLHVAPLTLGQGERLFDGVPTGKLEQVSARQASIVTHLVYRFSAPPAGGTAR